MTLRGRGKKGQWHTHSITHESESASTCRRMIRRTRSQRERERQLRLQRCRLASSFPPRARLTDTHPLPAPMQTPVPLHRKPIDDVCLFSEQTGAKRDDKAASKAPAKPRKKAEPAPKVSMQKTPEQMAAEEEAKVLKRHARATGVIGVDAEENDYVKVMHRKPSAAVRDPPKRIPAERFLFPTVKMCIGRETAGN